MNGQMCYNPAQILLVEDSPGDVRLTIEALRESKMGNVLHVVGDGVEAMSFLRKKGRYAHAPRPTVILLDLNLPKKDGREVLAEIKGDEELKRIPVVVLTTSEADDDIRKAYDCHANCYVTKPAGLHEFVKVVKAIENFWLRIVRLPCERE